MSIEQIENDIAGIYRWWAQSAPGVTPLEAGHLADLWALADYEYEKEAENG